MQHSSPSIAVIKKNMGELPAKAFITIILADLVMSFNIGKTMNQAQIVQTVDYLQRDYYFLKPSELKYCFDNAKMGRYADKGKPAVYDAIDMSVIFGWIEKYLEERMGIIEFENEQRHEIIQKHGTEETNHIQNLMTDERFVLNKQQQPESNTNTPKEILKPLEAGKLPYHDIHQKWLKQFDKLRMNDKWIVPGTNERFIYRYGSEINIEGYFKIKLEQLRIAKERKR